MEAAKLEKRASEKAAKVAGKDAMIAERKAAVAALSPEERKKVKATQRVSQQNHSIVLCQDEAPS